MIQNFKVFNNYIELYNAVLKLAVVSTKTTGTLFFDVPTNIHGTATTPITTNLAIDTTNIIDGAICEVIWSGSVNPNITGVPAEDIINFGPNITTQGIYSIFITHTGGKFKVNIQQSVPYVGDGDALSDPDVPPTGAPATGSITTIEEETSTGDTTAPATGSITTIEDEGDTTIPETGTITNIEDET